MASSLPCTLVPYARAWRSHFVPCAFRRLGRRAAGFDVDAYLARHGIQPRRIVLDASREPPGQALLQMANEENAQLLVMGPFGRLPGGTTQPVVRDASILEFLRH